MTLTIGTRGSELALFQSNLVKDLLADRGSKAELCIIKTVGDKINQLGFDKIEGKGFFTKELEEALLDERIDLAVHSLKDLPTELPPGLKVGAYTSPVDPSELLLIRPDWHDPDRPLKLKEGATVGTSSIRREAQLRFFRPDLHIAGLRGNVPTRIRKLSEGRYDAIVLAKAGVDRLQLDITSLTAIPLDPHWFLPAPGQGILAIEIRDNDRAVEEVIVKLNEPAAERTARMERGLLARFLGGCRLPLAVSTEQSTDGYCLRAFLGRKQGDGWKPSTRFEGKDSNIERLIERAYQKLTRPIGTASAITGKKVLITRAREDGEAYFKPHAGALEPVYYPVFEIVPNYSNTELDSVLSHISSYDWLLFTSRNSARILLDILKAKRVQLSASTRIGAVGKKTAELLESHGYPVSFVPRQEDSAGLLAEMSKLIDSKDQSVLLPQGEAAPNILRDGMIKLGLKVTHITLYKIRRTDAANLPTINSAEISCYIFTSPLSVKFFKELGHLLPETAWVAAIGQPTARALRDHYRAPDYIPQTADLHDIVNKIRECQ
ncbi:MAG: hydroxymethylbilane synthase [Candidatus Zixiibacteriota bacterium]|nr:MAG: hydroxymethylbilane synthase [candidate division Zixibacteria bacterium]